MLEDSLFPVTWFAIRKCIITRKLHAFVSRFKTLHLTYTETTSLPLISQFCDPHGNSHTLPQKLTARHVVVASSERETGRRGSKEEWDRENGI